MGVGSDDQKRDGGDGWVENGSGDAVLSVGEGGEWSDREVRVALQRAFGDGWNAALVRVGVLGGKRGGLGAGEESGDLRRLVGERFAAALEGVWLASLRYLRGTVPGDGGGMHGRMGSGGVRRATGLTDRRLMMRGKVGAKGVSAAVGGVVQDEAALAFKASVDRKLRKITREMESWLENRSSSRRDNVVRKCKKCRRYGEDSWQFCPFDGQKME